MHRAKRDNTAFSAALKRQKKYARRVLILTATPFSIRLDELKRMLTLIGGEAAHGPVRTFSRALEDLYTGNMRVIKVFDAPWRKIIDGTGAVSTPSAKVLRNRRFRVD